MTSDRTRFFGEPSAFGIRYKPGYRYRDYAHSFAFLHLVIGGQIIGDPEESCQTDTWLRGLSHLRTRVVDHFDELEHEAFAGRTDRELHELIWKANQDPDQYDPRFSYLPSLSNRVWERCHISIDETTDSWLVAMLACQGRLKFLSQGVQPPCPQDLIGTLFQAEVDPGEVVQIIDQCTAVVLNDERGFRVSAD